MRYFTYVFAIAACLSFCSVAKGQTADTTASMMEDPTPSATAKTEKVAKSGKPEKNYKDDKSMFDKKKRSWAIGLHGGLPLIQGDVAPGLGVGYGINIRKALGYSFSLRLNAINGYMTGLDGEYYGYKVLEDNKGVNGINDPNVNYFSANKGIYNNFKNSFTQVSVQAIYNVNNVNFMVENPRLGLYVFGGAGAMLYDVKIDQLDGSGKMYNYEADVAAGSASATKKENVKRLKSVLDGTYETHAEKDNNTYNDKNFTPVYTVGFGLEYRLSQRLSLALEGMYGYTGNDLLDGQRWYNANTLTSQPDGFGYANIGINIRLGRTDNAYWLSNPLALPYKTIQENKKKLQKVDKLEKDMADMGKKLDTLAMNVDSLKNDADHDGISDYFDMEENSPEGSVVDGSGRTLFYKDANGDLVFNDPNYKSNLGAGGNEMDENGNIIGSDGSVRNGSKGGSNSGGNKNGTGGGKPGKTKFNPNDPNGKTVFMKSDGKGGFMAPGNNSAIGYMPAVFFETNSSVVGTSAYPELFEVARALKMNPSVKVKVIGYTDIRNTEAYNKNLGMARAKAVMNTLVRDFGVNANQLVADTRGELDPLSNAKGLNSLAANRRVQFEIDGKGPAKMNSDLKNGTAPTKTTQAPQKPVEKKVTKPAPSPSELKEDVSKLLDETKPVPTDDSKKDEGVFTPDTDF